MWEEVRLNEYEILKNASVIWMRRPNRAGHEKAVSDTIKPAVG
jgi:hypothetical protein